jgi:YfiH family protein
VKLIQPDWPAPANIVALSTTRLGGLSEAPFDSLNLADHVGDKPATVQANRERLASHCAGLGAISWVTQVHGTTVVEADAANAPEADAQYTRTPGLGCAVLTADCLPVLLCSRDGTEVAAAHAGWRGLSAGVLEHTVAALATPADQLLAWLGPAIGPAAFEVGEEVREAFLHEGGDPALERCFEPAGRPGRWLADLCGLARVRLAAIGVSACFGGGWCTYTDRERFFSYRRDGITGRMASLIYIVPDVDERW